jgi:hypothetical protein
MLPENRLSTIPVPSAYLKPDGTRRSVRKDREYGGVALQDPTQGMYYQIWDFECVGNQILVSAPNHTRSLLLTHSSAVKEISATFDQNMNPCVAFVDAFDVAWLYWFDTVAGSQSVSDIVADFGAVEGLISPRVALDDKRQSQSGTSDILLMYVENKRLCMRRQRDRFLVEYVIALRVNASILDMGMARNGRFQLKMKYNGLQQQGIPPPVDPNDPNPPPVTPDPGIPGQPGGPIIPPPNNPPPAYPPNPPTPTSVALGVNLLDPMDVVDWGPYEPNYHYSGIEYSEPLAPGVMTEPSTNVFRVLKQNPTGDADDLIRFAPRYGKLKYDCPDGPIPAHRVRLQLKVRIWGNPPSNPLIGDDTYIALYVAVAAPNQNVVQRVEYAPGDVQGRDQFIDIDVAVRQVTSSRANRRVVPTFTIITRNLDAEIEISLLSFVVTSGPAYAMTQLAIPVNAGDWSIVSGTNVTLGTNNVGKTDSYGNGLPNNGLVKGNTAFPGLRTNHWLRVTYDINSTASAYGLYNEPGAMGGVYRGVESEFRARVVRGLDVPVISWHRVKSDGEQIYLGAALRCVANSACTVKNFTVELTDDPVLGLPYDYDYSPGILPGGY